MQTLTAEQVKNKYGEQALSAFTQTKPQSSYLGNVKNEISGSLQNSAEAQRQSNSGQVSPFSAGAKIASNLTSIPLAPITQAVKPLTDKVAPLISSITAKLGNTPAGQAFKSVVDKHPELSQAIFDIAQTGLNVTAIEGGISGVKKGVNLGQTSAKSAAGTVERLGTSVKQSVYGGPQPNFVDDLITPKLSPEKLSSVMKGGKVIEGQGLLGQRNLSEAIPNFQEIKTAVAEVPKVSPRNTFLQNLNAIHDEIGTVANKLESQVSNEKSFFSPNKFKSVMTNVKNSLGENPTIVGDAESASSKIITKFERLVQENGYTSSGLLKARKALDRWIMTQKGAKVFSPTTESGITTALSEIRQAGNNFLADISPNTSVKQLLKKQSNLYRAIEYIAPKAATEGNSLLSQFVKAHPITMKASKLLLEGTAIGKASNLLR